MKKHRAHGWSYFKVVYIIFLVVILFSILWWFYTRRGDFISVASPFIGAFILAYVLSPVVHLLENKGVSRLISIILIYLGIFMIIYLFVAGFLPTIMDDLQGLAQQIPFYVEKIQGFMEKIQEDYRRFNLPPAVREIVDENLEGMQQMMVSKLEKGYALIIDMFGRLVMLLLVPVLAFYLLYDERHLKKQLLKLVPVSYRKGFLEITREIDSQLGAYVRGMLIVSLSVGLTTYLGFLILGLEFPLILGIINGVTNLIPYLGPFLGAVPAIGVALLASPALALKVLILIIIVQQLESQLLSPLVLGRSINFHPLAIIFALLLGGKLFGFAGLILALPVALVLRILGRHAWIYLQKHIR